MEKTLHDLGGILLSGLPTLFLVLILVYFVQTLYVAPLKKVLAERHRLTEGAKKAAEDSLQNAESKIAEYEEALSRARGEIYRDQADILTRIHAEQAEDIRAVRAEAEQRIAAAKQAIAEEAAAARQHLEAQSDALAGQIADSILTRRVA
jgi:F0F1-type ATP synthase membrane subunit b/b'